MLHTLLTKWRWISRKKTGRQQQRKRERERHNQLNEIHNTVAHSNELLAQFFFLKSFFFVTVAVVAPSSRSCYDFRCKITFCGHKISYCWIIYVDSKKLQFVTGEDLPLLAHMPLSVDWILLVYWIFFSRDFHFHFGFFSRCLACRRMIFRGLC